MEPPRRRPFREFLQSPIGRVLILALGIVVVFGAFYVTVLLAIPAILIVGIWIPIWVGIKRPRYLAIAGLVILLLVAPLITVSFTGELLQPVGPASSHSGGIPWSVTIGNTTVSSQSDRITFHLPSGTESYNITPIAGFSVAPRLGSVDVGTSPVSVPVTFTAEKYAVTFDETGLPIGTSWGVTIGATSQTSTTSSLGFELANGSYAFRIGPVPKETPPTSTGSLRVEGAPTALTIPFSRTAYASTFSATGLPLGSSWRVTAGSMTASSDGASLVLDLPNGTIPYAAASNPVYTTVGGQAVDVSGGPTSVTVAFSPEAYPVTFAESQLPSGANWGIAAGGTTVNSTTGTVILHLVNGTYPYSVNAPTGYSPVAGNNTIRVAGGATGAPIVFNATTFPAKLEEAGLPAGTPWTVTVGSTTVVTTANVEILNLSVGNHPYTIGHIGGYAPPPGGSIDIAGTGVGVTVTFAPVKYPVVFTESYLASGTSWNVTINGISHPSAGLHVEFNLTNGTYSYRIGPPSGKTPPSTNATVQIDGAGASIAVPFATTSYAVVFTQTGLPSGPGTGAVQDVTVTPFHGASSTVFTWSATIYPQYLPSTQSSPLWISLYVSTCPGATSPNSSAVCTPGYPFVALTEYFCSDPATAATCEATVQNLTVPTTVSFNYTIGEDGIWDWQMGLASENLATHTPTTTLLVGDPMYDSIEGPIIGSYGTIFEVVLPSVYLEDFLYLGAPFYAVLLLYAFFKNRERRRNDARQRNAGPIPPTSGAEALGPDGPGRTSPLGSAAAAPTPPGPAAGETACPNCQAIVYPGEAKCWKCGSAITSGPPPPLPPG